MTDQRPGPGLYARDGRDGKHARSRMKKGSGHTKGKPVRASSLRERDAALMSALAARAERFQILALDGGGVKALFTANVLALLEQDLGIEVRDCFDLITGTSAGGIVALGLGAGLRPAMITESYHDIVAAVFPSGGLSKVVRGALRPMYSQEALREALTNVFGERLLCHSDKRLVVPSYDVGSGQVHVFKTPHHERLRRDWRIPMVDVALATTAAPAYFPAAAVDHVRLIDGGVWANNPSVIGIAEALSVLDVPREAVRVLNIGTTPSGPDIRTGSMSVAGRRGRGTWHV